MTIFSFPDLILQHSTWRGALLLRSRRCLHRIIKDPDRQASRVDLPKSGHWLLLRTFVPLFATAQTHQILSCAGGPPSPARGACVRPGCAALRLVTMVAVVIHSGPTSASPGLSAQICYRIAEIPPIAAPRASTLAVRSCMRAALPRRGHTIGRHGCLVC